MAEAVVQIIKRNHVSVLLLAKARIVINTLSIWFKHHNAIHLHNALGYLSPRKFIASPQSQ